MQRSPTGLGQIRWRSCCAKRRAGWHRILPRKSGQTICPSLRQLARQALAPLGRRIIPIRTQLNEVILEKRENGFVVARVHCGKLERNDKTTKTSALKKSVYSTLSCIRMQSST